MSSEKKRAGTGDAGELRAASWELRHGELDCCRRKPSEKREQKKKRKNGVPRHILMACFCPGDRYNQTLTAEIRSWLHLLSNLPSLLGCHCSRRIGLLTYLAPVCAYVFVPSAVLSNRPHHTAKETKDKPQEVGSTLPLVYCYYCCTHSCCII